MTVEKKQILTVKNIRNINIENILHSVIRGKSVTRNVLAKENEISLMTVKHIVDALIAENIIVEKDCPSTEVGRKPKVLEIAENYGNIVCVNLTWSDEISFLIYDIYENLLEEQTISLESNPSYLDGLYATIDLIQKKLEEIDSMTVGVVLFVPGAYDDSVDSVNYDLIPDFKELHIKSLFQEKFKINNILVLHDVFAAARAEYDSLETKPESQFYFYCGYGVGGFFIHQGEAVFGNVGMAGEVGKMLISMNGSDDENLTLEDVASISAIKKKMKERGMDIHYRELFALYKEGDVCATEILEPVFNTISKVLYNLLWVYNPSKLVIDSCRSIYCELMETHFRKYIDKMKNDAIPISVEVGSALCDEYHMMRGCFNMARNAWIKEITESI